MASAQQGGTAQKPSIHDAMHQAVPRATLTVHSPLSVTRRGARDAGGLVCFKMSGQRGARNRESCHRGTSRDMKYIFESNRQQNPRAESTWNVNEARRLGVLRKPRCYTKKSHYLRNPLNGNATLEHRVKVGTPEGEPAQPRVVSRHLQRRCARWRVLRTELLP